MLKQLYVSIYQRKIETVDKLSSAPHSRWHHCEVVFALLRNSRNYLVCGNEIGWEIYNGESGCPGLLFMILCELMPYMVM